MIAGRTCPIDYYLTEDDFYFVNLNDDGFLVAGGLYGNRFALDELKRLQGDDVLIFNGDMHWFDKNYEDFLYVEEKTKDDLKIMGNVECELIRNDDIGAGCGCAYPACTSDDAVERSNAIHKELKTMFVKHDDLKEMLKDRLKAFIIESLGLRFLILHGDEKSIAGWDNSKEELIKKERQDEIKKLCEIQNIDAILCTHTCSQVIFDWDDKILVNNGATGMNSVKNMGYGLYTRVSKTSNDNAIYSKKIKDVYVELVPLYYDNNDMINWFDSVWYKNSPASISYRDRIVNGVDCEITIIKEA